VASTRRVDPDARIIIPILHPTDALSYSPYSKFHSIYLSDPIPGRILAKRVDLSSTHGRNNNRSSVSKSADFNTSILGVLAKTAHRDATSETKAVTVTSFDYDRDGNFPLEEGKHYFRIIHTTPTKRGMSEPKPFNETLGIGPWANHVNPRDLRSTTQRPGILEKYINSLGGRLYGQKSGVYRENIQMNGVPEFPVLFGLRLVQEAEFNQAIRPGSRQWIQPTETNQPPPSKDLWSMYNYKKT